MTSEERFERIEHVTAALVEERRKDREEYRQLWRDTQRQIDALARKISDTNDTVMHLAESVDRIAGELRDSDQRLSDRIDRLAVEMRESDRRLSGRVDNLVSAIGQYIAQQQKQ